MVLIQDDCWTAPAAERNLRRRKQKQPLDGRLQMRCGRRCWRVCVLGGCVIETVAVTDPAEATLDD